MHRLCGLGGDRGDLGLARLLLFDGEIIRALLRRLERLERLGVRGGRRVDPVGSLVAILGRWDRQLRRIRKVGSRVAVLGRWDRELPH